MNQNYDFLKTSMRLQHDIMFDQLVELDSTIIGFSHLDPSPCWNLALVNQPIDNQHLHDVEKVLNQAHRDSTIYYQNRPDLDKLTQQLTSHNYHLEFTDAWKCWPGSETDQEFFNQVKKVESENQLDDFIQAFDLSFQANDPQNPFGAAGASLDVARKNWHKHHQSGRIEYFIVYDQDTPAAISALTNFQGIGYIYYVGSVQDFRGEGYGKTATLYAVSKSIQNGNQTHCLTTEANSHPDEFYQHIGFETKFTALGYTKKLNH